MKQLKQIGFSIRMIVEVLVKMLNTYMHSLGALQCPCWSLHPGKQRAEKYKEKKTFGQYV